MLQKPEQGQRLLGYRLLNTAEPIRNRLRRHAAKLRDLDAATALGIAPSLQLIEELLCQFHIKITQINPYEVKIGIEAPRRFPFSEVKSTPGATMLQQLIGYPNLGKIKFQSRSRHRISSKFPRAGFLSRYV